MANYESYKSLYKQDFTIPTPYMEDVNINAGYVAVFFVLFILNSMILVLFSLGGANILFVPRPVVALVVTGAQLYALSKAPTAGKPLIIWLFYVPYFIFFIPKQTRAFQPVKLRKKWREKGAAAFRPVMSTVGKEVQYAMLPLVGQTNKFEGLTFKTKGATRFIFHPMTRQVSMQVAPYESLKPVSKKISKLTSTVLDVGRGEVRVKIKAGSPHVEYVPMTDIEGGME